jgi:hypothetical protein
MANEETLFDKWLKQQPDLQDKYAISTASKFERFYITGEDLQRAFAAGYLIARQENRLEKNCE